MLGLWRRPAAVAPVGPLAALKKKSKSSNDLSLPSPSPSVCGAGRQGHVLTILRRCICSSLPLHQSPVPGRFL